MLFLNFIPCYNPGYVGGMWSLHGNPNLADVFSKSKFAAVQGLLRLFQKGPTGSRLKRK